MDMLSLGIAAAAGPRDPAVVAESPAISMCPLGPYRKQMWTLVPISKPYVDPKPLHHILSRLGDFLAYPMIICLAQACIHFLIRIAIQGGTHSARMYGATHPNQF